jgi:hypothetical protein
VNQRVREIVDLLVEMIANAVDLPITEISLIERLVRRGYHLGEIDEALETMLSLPSTVTLTEPGETGRMRTHLSSRRLLAPDERFALSTEAQGALLRMFDSGLITDVELEETLLEVVGQGWRDMGVSELLLLLMRIIRDEDRLTTIALNLFKPRAADGGEIDPN